MEMQVLLVEDDEALARMVKLRLEKLKTALIEVVHVSSAEQAIEWLSAAKADVIILDLNLPDTKGLDTFDKVSMHALATPIVVASGEDRDVLRQVFQRGAFDYIEKGKFDPKETAERLRQAIDAHAKDHQARIKSLVTLEKEVAELEKPDSARNRLRKVRRITQELKMKDDSDG